MKTIAVMAAALMLLGAQDAPAGRTRLDGRGWIEAKGDAWAEECWTHARGGLMIGAGDRQG